MPIIAAARCFRLVDYLGSQAIGSDGFVLLGRAELRHLRLKEHLALLHLLPLGRLLPQCSHLRMPCALAKVSRTAQLLPMTAVVQLLRGLPWSSVKNVRTQSLSSKILQAKERC